MKQLVVVGGIIEYNGKILCMQRNKGKYDYTSYKYEFPGGKLEEGETYPQALMRELREEMDMKVFCIGMHCIYRLIIWKYLL